jgi:hypothetical protein
VQNLTHINKSSVTIHDKPCDTGLDLPGHNFRERQLRINAASRAGNAAHLFAAILTTTLGAEWTGSPPVFWT